MTEPDTKPNETSAEEAASGPEATSAAQATEQASADHLVAAAPAEQVSPDDSSAEPAEQASSEQGTEAAGEAEVTSSGDAEAAQSGEGPGKKKRRRRRKKKGAQPSEAPAEGKGGHHHAPFLAMFPGGAARKHAFSVGEVVAGRVDRVDRGIVSVDLFGKATAIADVNEPREIPLFVQPSTVPEPVESAPVAPVTAPVEVAAATVTGDGATAPPTESQPTPTPETTAPVGAAVSAADAESWEFLETQTSDIPYPDLVEADTVVGAQAYVPDEAPAPDAAHAPSAEGVIAEPEVSALATTEPGTVEAGTTTEAATNEAGSDTKAAEGPGRESQAPAAPEDLSDADLSLLEPLAELPAPEVGAIFRGRIGGVAESGHIVIVNRDINKPEVRKAIRAARAKHDRVWGVVYGFNRGGFDVLVGGVRAFCPASAMSLKPIEDPNELVGQRCEFSLPQDKGGSKKSIIVSRRNILEKEARKRARERMAELQVGQRLPGKVLEVRDYGVLVDLGDGLDGLVHLSEVSWSRGVRPADVAKPGDDVEVAVIKVQQATRKDRYGRVSLSMRACMPDPFEAAADTLRPGTPIKGKVVRTTDFGAFVEVAENIEGLLHISELGGNKELTHAKQALQEGDVIDVVIERVDREQRRVSLSKLSEQDAKAIEAGEIEVGKAPRNLKPGTHVTVVIKRVEHGGVQVQVDGMLGKRGRGFIPHRELEGLQGEKRKGPSQGDLIEVKVLGTDRDGTLRCSVRARLMDDERKAVREYRKESAKQGFGTFGDLLKAKLDDSPD